MRICDGGWFKYACDVNVSVVLMRECEMLMVS